MTLCHLFTLQLGDKNFLVQAQVYLCNKNQRRSEAVPQHLKKVSALFRGSSLLCPLTFFVPTAKMEFVNQSS